VAEGKGPLGQGDLSLALKSLAGGWSGWHKEEDMSSPDIDVYDYDDGEGNYYGRGTIEHNLKTGEIKVEFNSAGKVGINKKYVTVTSNAVNGSEVVSFDVIVNKNEQ
jgi:hypothetical protein